ncbi:MAG: LptA/OstA family protein [Nitrospiraceae bacterium]
MTLVIAWTTSSAEMPITKPASSEATTTTITSQRMTVRNQENKAVFEGAVVLTKGNLIVHSDLMVVFFKPANQTESAGPSDPGSNGKAKASLPDEKEKSAGSGNLPIMANRSVSMIEATGRVRIVKEDGQATCRKAIYHGDEDKIVLTGDPVAWQKGTRVTGQKIIMYLAEDRSVVEGGSHVMIEPEGGASR